VKSKLNRATVQQRTALYEARWDVMVCEALFALSHKASFDANKPNQRFAALNKIITDLFGRKWVMHALLHLPHSGRNLSRRTPRSSEHHAENSVYLNDPLNVMSLNSKR